MTSKANNQLLEDIFQRRKEYRRVSIEIQPWVLLEVWVQLSSKYTKKAITNWKTNTAS